MTDPLSQRVKITEAITSTAGAAAATDINGAILDMTGFESVLIVVVFGPIVGTAVTGIRAQRDTDAAGGTMADIEGTAVAVADDDDEKTFYLDVIRPGEQYVRVVVDRATANATVRAAFYIQYDAHEHPVAAHGATVSGEVHVDAIEGTA